MLNTVSVTNASKETLVMELAKPWTSGMNITNIDGLGPMEVEINSSNFGFFDGSQVNNIRKASREIKFEIKFYSDNGYIENLRQKTYRYFPLKEKIRLGFETDNRSVYIEGYVKSNEPNIFSKDENTVITVFCPEPWFQSTSDTTLYLNEGYDQFEFPFSNESLTSNLIVISEIRTDGRKLITNNGIERGFELEIVFPSSFKESDLKTPYSVVIENGEKSQTFKFNPNGRRIFKLSTVEGNTYFVCYDDHKLKNYLRYVDFGSDWPRLLNGNNYVYMLGAGSKGVSLVATTNTVYEGI